MTSSVAVVGCGYWGKNLARNFAELGALAAVVDASDEAARAVGEQHGVPAMAFDAVLARPEIAGVVIAAPAELHADLAMRALGAGKHVFVEKPMALNEADALAMTRAAERADRTLMVGHLLQYHPAFETLLAMVRAGELGALRYAYSHRLSLGKFRIEENALWSLAPHDISMLLALFAEEPERVTGLGAAHVTPGVEDWFRIDLAFSGDRHAHVFASWLHPVKQHQLTVVGAKAMAVFEDSAPAGQKLRLYRHGVDTAGREPQASKAEAEFIAYPAAEPLRRECEHFLGCIAGQANARTGPDEALPVLRTLLRASLR
jgi:predicted dehydrogenase